MQSMGKTVIFQIVETSMNSENIGMNSMKTLRKIMASLKQQARIFYLMSYEADVRNMLISAYDEGMITGI